GVTMLSLLDQEGRSNQKEVSLPSNAPLDLSLKEVIKKRRSVREYTGDSMNIDCLATLLRSACGVLSQTAVKLKNGHSTTLNLRAVPSAGGLYPIEVFAAALKVKDLERSIYRYQPLEDILIMERDSKGVDLFLSSFAVPDEIISISRATAIFIFI